ncbi:YndM family protein [Ornithinibacillus xuwenensis]|uniref:YndM family protein n=1 Tax=Ornithinibacillus xuwenensis TaxID=3144668 RepID=A0ABU9XKM9_9BACI
MKYVTSFLLKFIMIAIVLWIVLGMVYEVSLNDILLTSFIMSAVAYMIDIYILPSVSNFWATIADFGLAFAGIWITVQYLSEANISLADASLISALIIAVGEYFYHCYMKKQILDDTVSTSPKDLKISQNRMQTEFSSDLDEDH